MPIGFKSIAGLTEVQSNDGMAIAAIPGDTGLGPSIAVLTASATGLAPNDGSIVIQIFPTAKIASGTDLNGNISVQTTLFNTGNDKLFNVSGGGTVNLTDGFWAQHIRGTVNSLNGSRGFDIQFTSLDPTTDFNQTLTDSPQNARVNPGDGPNWDNVTQQGDVTITFTYTNTHAENPDAFVVMRTKVGSGNPAAPVGSTPWDGSAGPTDFKFQDFVFEPGEFTYTIQAYKYGVPNIISIPGNVVDLIFGGPLPDIEVTGGGGGTGHSDSVIQDGIDIGGSAVLIFISEPSGIYTMVPGKTHDTLYNRGSDPIDVKIPNPFVKIPFVGD